MYKNLKAEMARNDITQEELARKMNMSLSAISIRLRGKKQFTVNEAKKVKQILKTDLPLEVLFEEAI